MHRNVSELRRELDLLVARVLNTAGSAQSSDEWAQMLTSWTEISAPEFSAGGQARGDQVREVLIAVVEHFERKFKGLPPSESEVESDQRWEFERHRLSDLVVDEMKNYSTSIRQAGSSVAGIFGRAQARVERSPALETKTVETLRCQGCGSPRSAESLYENCLFCGQPFFSGSADHG